MCLKLKNCLASLLPQYVSKEGLIGPVIFRPSPEITKIIKGKKAIEEFVGHVGVE
jgi:hypothetical protein